MKKAHTRILADHVTGDSEFRQPRHKRPLPRPSPSPSRTTIAPKPMFISPGVVKNGGFGKFRHGRELAPPAQQGIIRPNRDTLYSFAMSTSMPGR